MLNRYCLTLIFTCLCLLTATAQTCQYQLLLQDTAADGWNDGQITLRQNGVVTTYTLTEEDGARRSFFFSVTEGDALELDYTAGQFPDETSFSLLDNNDSLLYASVQPLVSGTNIFAYTVICVPCAPPPANSFEFFRVRSTSVDVRFGSLPAAENPRYRIRYGAGDYDPTLGGGGLEVTGTDTTYRIRNLEADSRYSFWIDAICRTTDDTTALRGPFEVITQKRRDLGVTRLAAPLTACDLSSERVTIGITNFGGEPQAFFNVDYTINGSPSGLSRPADGIYTGVVGVDSTELFTFDTRALMFDPGTYEFRVWTALEGDEDNSNDTMTFTVVHQLQTTEFPYFENFEANNGFWYDERDGRGISSWRWGQPAAPFIDRAPNGRNAWVTNLRGDHNDREKSYLVSPCFDLSGVGEDPLFSAILRVRTETNFDGVYLEMTKDDGRSWQLIENSPAATNWYNNLADQRWEGDGGNGDRAFLISNLLPGAAGDTVQLRFVFESNRNTTMEGVLVDAVSLGERVEKNLAAVSASSVTDCALFSPADFEFIVANVGTTAVDSFRVGYLTSTGAEQTDFYAIRLIPGQQTTVVVDPFVSLAMLDGQTPIWAILEGDEETTNDTAYVVNNPLMSLPFYEDFTTGRLPDFWSTSPDFSIAPAPISGSNALVAGLSPTETSKQFATARFEQAMASDTLRFTVELKDSTGNDFTGKASLEIMSFDCDIAGPVTTIDSLVNGIYAISLDGDNPIGGQFIFTITADSGAFTVSFDDINVARCGPNLGLIAEVVGVSAPGEEDAIVTVTPTAGIAPYTFLWSTGDETMTVDGLGEGPLTIFVTDVVGCTDSVTFTVDMSTPVEDPLELLSSLSVFPNPTANALELRLDLDAPLELQASLYDLTGRELFRRDFGRQQRLSERLDVSAFPAGIYLLRLQSEAGARTLRVVKR